MTEEKGCKNCDALGVDSEIGVYYCCLSHRQDDLPKELICDDFTPNKQLKRLEQENKELGRKAFLAEQNVRTTASTFCEKDNKIVELEQENKELKEKITALEDKLQLRMVSDKESDAFWDEIFSEEDYPFNKENVYKELKDYYFVLEQLPKIYMEITGGTLSKTTYFASSVIQAYNDALERYYDKIDDLEYNNNAYRSALEEIRILATKNVSIENFVKIQNKINEVLANEV